MFMNKHQQEALVDFFEELIAFQTNIKATKRQLKKEMFNAEACFQMISLKHPHLTIDYFEEEVQSLGLHTKEESYEMFSRIDRSRNGYISLPDFRQFFEEAEPKQKTNKLHLQAGKHSEGFSQLMRVMLEGIRLIRIAAKPLAQIPLWAMFNELDIYKIGYLSVEALQKFMQANHRPLIAKEARLLLDGIKQNGIYKYANLEVFGECVNPIELGFYEGYNSQLAFLQEKKYSEIQTKQRLERENEAVHKAFNRSKQGSDARKKQKYELERRLEEDMQRQVQVRELMRREREARRHELENEKDLRRQILIQEQEIARCDTENINKGHELYNLIQAHESESHLNYLLNTEAKINDLELRQTRKRTEEFELQLARIRAETIRKKDELQRRLDEPPQYYSFPRTNILKELDPIQPQNRMAESLTYFKQPIEQLHSLYKPHFSPKTGSNTSKSTWFDAESRSRIEAIELELRKTELELEMRRNKIQLEDRIAREREELALFRLGSALR